MVDRITSEVRGIGVVIIEEIGLLLRSGNAHQRCVLESVGLSEDGNNSGLGGNSVGWSRNK
jgi:hypothetical protein